MEKRETYKSVEIGDRKFLIKKFDALTGSYIAYKLMAEMLPMGLGAQLGIPEANKTIMSRADFADLQRDCLKVCFEQLPAGIAQVMNENGTWGVMDIEDDAKIALTLTIHALMFNITSFFDGSLLNSIVEAMSNISLPGAKT